MNHLYFRVAESYFDIDYKYTDDLRSLIPSYAPFHVNKADIDKPPMFTMEVGGTPIPFEETGHELGQFDCGGINHGIYLCPDGGYRMLISHYDGTAACAMAATADFRNCRSTLYGENTSHRAFGLGNAMMIAFAFAGAYHNILLMHSSVVMKDGGGHLFLGKSGTGKSTHSRQWLSGLPDTELLNDDNPALRFMPGRDEVIVYGTPWSGKTPCYKNLNVPVRAIVRLEQYPENIIRRESPLQGFASVLSSCSTMIWDRESYRRICATVNEVARRIPVFYLQCLPDHNAAEVCHTAIREAWEKPKA